MVVRMIYTKILSIIILILLALAGCHRYPGGEQVITYYPFDAGADNARAKLTEAAVSASASLNQIAAIEKATHPEVKKLAVYSIPGIASVDWTGPIEPLALRLAQAAGYKFRVIGNRPAIPVIVEIYTVNMPIADILRDCNYQAGKKADIFVYPSRRTVELRYRSP